jgi:hypothetical protein
MRHASAESLCRIGALLDKIRNVEVLKEKTPGVFYWRSRAFLHFHEDEGSLYADVRLDGPDFDRFCLDRSTDQNRLLRAIQRQVRVQGKNPPSRSTRSRAR